MGKVLIAIDDSEHSVRAWEMYKENIRRPDDEVILVHCLEIPYEAKTMYPLRAEVVQDLFDKAKEQGQGVEIKFKTFLKEAEVGYKLVSEFGKPGELIVSKAEELGATMIIMGTRGLGKFRRTVLGSVSDYVVHHAHCPVLIARH